MRGVRLVDRLFSFWRLPAWSDAVQVLLWLLGWSVVLAFAVVAALLLPIYLRGASLGDDWGQTFRVVGLITLLMTAGWFIVGAWFISEAYRTWRVGHRYGRQWTAMIGVFLVLSVAGFFLSPEDQGTVGLAGIALRAAFGLALLVACFTTKPPSSSPITTA